MVDPRTTETMDRLSAAWAKHNGIVAERRAKKDALREREVAALESIAKSLEILVSQQVGR